MGVHEAGETWTFYYHVGREAPLVGQPGEHERGVLPVWGSPGFDDGGAEAGRQCAGDGEVQGVWGGEIPAELWKKDNFRTIGFHENWSVE